MFRWFDDGHAINTWVYINFTQNLLFLLNSVFLRCLHYSSSTEHDTPSIRC